LAFESSKGNGQRPRLLVVQRRLTHYRLPFFEGVRRQLQDAGIDFTLAHGDPTPDEREKRDEGHLDWAIHAPCTYALGGRLCWQPLRSLIERHDYAIVTQENKMLNNIPLLLGSQRCRIGLWGHGRNFQSAQGRMSGVAQALKAALSRRADWWFAYTEISAQLVREFGYPKDRITVLNNSIDTAELVASVSTAHSVGRAVLRRKYDLPPEGPVGLYIGSLYAEKRLDLLIDGAIEVQRRQPDFRLVIVGGGPEAGALAARAASLPWVRILGPRKGQEKAELLASADVILNPGLVGLGILDAFAAGLPIITTDCDLHSPEIAYLEHDANGVMTAPNAESFAEAVDGILRDAVFYERLCEGARRSAKSYGIDAMIDNFCRGVVRWQSSQKLKEQRHQ